VGIGSDSDLFTALSDALEKLDTQAVKARGKWREKHRRKDSDLKPPEPPAEASASSGKEEAAKRVFRVNGLGRRKPMTLDEALLEMDDRDYLVYRDAQREGLSVLVRRRDGHFDLIES
jgi:putative sigma-54 modulation protein